MTKGFCSETLEREQKKQITSPFLIKRVLEQTKNYLAKLRPQAVCVELKMLALSKKKRSLCS